MSKYTPAIFLDRDGTINIDYGYVYEIDKFRFINGVVDAMRELKEMGYILVIVTNQSGIAYGKFTETQFKLLTEWMIWSLVNYGVYLDGIYYCPNHPQGSVEIYRQTCSYRKPCPGMLTSAQKHLHINMAASYMIGDKVEDMQAAKAAGVGNTVLVNTGKLITLEDKIESNWVISSLAELPKLLRECGNKLISLRKHKQLKQKVSIFSCHTKIYSYNIYSSLY